MNPDDATAQALLAAVRAAQEEHDPVPPDVLAAAKGSYAWRTIDAELAELVEDTALDALAGVRGTEAPRLLTFLAGPATLMLEVTSEGAARRVLGQVAGAAAGSVEVRHRDGRVTVPCDALGRFEASDVPAGPLSIGCAVDGVGTVVTSWVTV